MAEPMRATDEDAISMLETDHRLVEDLHERFQRASSGEDKTRIAGEIVRELSMHAAIEEMIFYPAVRESVGDSDELVDHALDEHQGVKEGLVRLERLDATDPAFAELLDEIMSEVAEHVDDEENEMFPKVRRAIEQQRLVEMARAMGQAKTVAPTRPHPHAPNEPPANVIAGGVAGMTDRIRDAVAKKLGKR